MIQTTSPIVQIPIEAITISPNIILVGIAAFIGAFIGKLIAKK
jgi:hypothetical protein